MLLISADTYIPSKHTQDLCCSFLFCQSHLALINEKNILCSFSLDDHDQNCFLHACQVGCCSQKHFETRSRSPSALGGWVKFNLLVWIYSGPFLICVDWHQVFIVLVPWAKLFSVKLWLTQSTWGKMVKNTRNQFLVRRLSFCRVTSYSLY